MLGDDLEEWDWRWGERGSTGRGYMHICMHMSHVVVLTQHFKANILQFKNRKKFFNFKFKK